MDKLTIVVILLTVALLYSVLRLMKLKREIYQFADQLEQDMETVLSGKKLDDAGVLAESLSGKFKEKLLRMQHIWELKDQESMKEKQMMRELISDISHQTKTPIANQKIYLEILKTEELATQETETITRLEKQTEKLDFLLQSMVKMSRLETGIIRIQQTEHNLVETVGQAVAAVVPSAAAKRIEIYADCGEEYILSYDVKWTEEAIFNLLDNAVKYTMPEGQIHISLTRQEIFTKISVKDTGRGIPVEHQAQIFTRFYREPEVHEQSGIGIGLFLVRKIAELQGGYVEVQSESGKGAEFSIYLPNIIS